MSRYVVSGATGFLGRVLVRRLATRHRVTALVRPGSNTASLPEGTHLVDLEQDGIGAAFSGEPVDAVIHCATDYGRGGATASRLVETNLVFSLKLLEAASEAGAGGFINIATSLGPEVNPYALSKAQFAEWLKSREWGLKAVNLPLEFMYGPGDNAHSFISWALSALLRGEESLPLTPGEQRRDFIFVEDAARAVETVATNLAGLPAGFSQVPAGSGETVSIREFLELAQSLTRGETRLEFGALPYRAGEAMESRADISLLASWGWQPEVGLKQGLENTIAHLADGPKTSNA